MEAVGSSDDVGCLECEVGIGFVVSEVRVYGYPKRGKERTWADVGASKQRELRPMVVELEDGLQPECNVSTVDANGLFVLYSPGRVSPSLSVGVGMGG